MLPNEPQIDEIHSVTLFAFMTPFALLNFSLSVAE